MKQRVVFKLYWDFEKEERWLNRMATNGQALVRRTWCTYTFEQCAPGEWIYRIELLPQGVRRPASQEYLAFAADAGVDTVATQDRWVYFRKPAADGPFEVFSDRDSRIAHYRRVLALLTSLFAALVPITASNVINSARGRLPLGLAYPVFTLLLVTEVILATQAVRVAQRLRHLEAERRVFE